MVIRNSVKSVLKIAEGKRVHTYNGGCYETQKEHKDFPKNSLVNLHHWILGFSYFKLLDASCMIKKFLEEVISFFSPKDHKGTAQKEKLEMFWGAVLESWICSQEVKVVFV